MAKKPSQKDIKNKNISDLKSKKSQQELDKIAADKAAEEENYHNIPGQAPDEDEESPDVDESAQTQEDEAEAKPLPKQITMIKDCRCQFAVAGRLEVLVTVKFKAGQIVTDPHSIQRLVEAQAVFKVD